MRVSVHNNDGCFVLEKEEGVEGIVKGKKARRVAKLFARNFNLFDDFLVLVDQLQWLLRDTSNY
jgi:hypothetical protein